jgi:hypothetical protein
MNSSCDTIQRKSLLYKTGVEYGDYTINHVQGCSHGCKYPCYAFLMSKRFGSYIKAILDSTSDNEFVTTLLTQLRLTYHLPFPSFCKSHTACPGFSWHSILPPAEPGLLRPRIAGQAFLW